MRWLLLTVASACAHGPEQLANRYLLIAAAKPTAGEALAAAPAGATIVDSSAFMGLRPCLEVAVIGTYEKKADAFAAAAEQKARGIEALPRYAGRYVADEAVRRARCARAPVADLRAPRFVLPGARLDASRVVRPGEAFDVYTADGAPVAARCPVTGLVSEPNDRGDRSPCTDRIPLGRLGCAAGGEGQFALPSGLPAQPWSRGGDDAAALKRLLSAPAVNRAKADLKKFTETTGSAGWTGPLGRVTFAWWEGVTGRGFCSDPRSTVSEVLLWPPGGGPPEVLFPAAERDEELIGVTDVGGDGRLELTWRSWDDVWMETVGGATLYLESHPFCGCRC